MTNLDEYFANKGDETVDAELDADWLKTELQMRLLLDAVMNSVSDINIDNYTEDELKMIDDDVVVLALWEKFQKLDSWLLTRVCHENAEWKYEDALERLCRRGPGGYERRRNFFRGARM